MSKDKIKKYLEEHGDTILIEATKLAIGVTVCAVCYSVGYCNGKSNMGFAVHSAVKGDREKFLKLCDKGIACYSGKNLKNLNIAAEAFKKLEC